LDNTRLSSSAGSNLLLGEEAGCTLWAVFELAALVVKEALDFGTQQYTSAQEQLDFLVAKVTQAIVPAEELFFRLAQVGVEGTAGGEQNLEE
jgi:hypothetical protein